MKTRKNLMVLVLLSLFLSVGVADTKGITEEQAEIIVESMPNLSVVQEDISMGILEELTEAKISVSADKFRELVKSPKDIETIKKIFPQITNNSKLQANINDIVDESKLDLDEISDEELEATIASIAKDKAEIEKDKAEIEKNNAEAEKYRRRADEVGRRADEVGRIADLYEEIVKAGEKAGLYP